MTALKTLVHFHEVPSVPWIGGGDPDIFSKSGRKTRMILEANDLRVREDGKALLVRLTYDVKEMRTNNTHLRYEGEVSIPVPLDWNAKVLQLADVTDFYLQTTFVGENHQWNEINLNTPNSCLQSARAKVDGPGNDDQGNAALQVTFRIPVLVDDAH
ncbi:hypothetical protein [Alkalinema sp. FACHB-956]|uniref:hypothetical protein n=1 Tax=Alkalinema sp. FACHB-956 TaxID=2692768 RepID=UPI0016831440|nr:hypothetical protein [Alkalinema sp. FACHB-956]MBD2328210.1 hypothetical protein [Alkalinema sp. FACHB-956]